MKRLSLLTAAGLLASTPLFAMDGGGVSISGEANFGVKFAESDDDSKSELQFHHEFKVTFAASGTTDGGIGFGGKMTLDNTESVAVGTKGAVAGTPITLLDIAARGDIAGGADAVITTSADDADTFVGINDKGKITYVGETGGKDRYKLGKDPADATSVIIVVDGKPVLVPTADIGGADDIWDVITADGTAAAAITGATNFLYKVGPGVGPMTAATAASFDPDASNKIDNHGEVYISMDMHKLTIGS
ncbi:MAG: porin, partial [Rhodobacteraceae bacterium]|nr:porin [Paracoccaceae bacterium]